VYLYQPDGVAEDGLPFVLLPYGAGAAPAGDGTVLGLFLLSPANISTGCRPFTTFSQTCICERHFISVRVVCRTLPASALFGTNSTRTTFLSLAHGENFLPGIIPKISFIRAILAFFHCAVSLWETCSRLGSCATCSFTGTTWAGKTLLQLKPFLSPRSHTTSLPCQARALPFSGLSMTGGAGGGRREAWWQACLANTACLVLSRKWDCHEGWQASLAAFYSHRGFCTFWTCRLLYATCCHAALENIS